MPSAPAAAAPATASTVLYRERMSPGPGVLLVAAVTGAVFGVVLIPLSLIAAVIVGVVAAVAACAGVVLASPVVEISPARVTAGAAAIAPELLGEAEALDPEGWARTMGTGFEPLAFHCTRGWVRSGVRIPVLDPADPTSAWVISSRSPERLALALDAARGAGRAS